MPPDSGFPAAGEAQADQPETDKRERGRLGNAVRIDAVQAIVVGRRVIDQIVQTLRNGGRGRGVGETAPEFQSPLAGLRFEEQDVQRIQARLLEKHGRRRPAERMDAVIVQHPDALNVDRAAVVGRNVERPCFVVADYAEEPREAHDRVQHVVGQDGGVIQRRLGRGVENRAIRGGHGGRSCRAARIVDRARQEVGRGVAAADDGLRLDQRIRIRIDVRPQLSGQAGTRHRRKCERRGAEGVSCIFEVCSFKCVVDSFYVQGCRDMTDDNC